MIELKTEELAQNADLILLPDRYQEPFTEALQDLLGQEIPTKDGRKCTIISNGRTFQWVRGRDVPKLVEAYTINDPKINTIGMTGTEWYEEYANEIGFTFSNNRVASYKPIGRISLIAKESLNFTAENLGIGRGKESVKVVTALPNLVRRVRIDKALNIETLLSLNNGVSGGVEGIANQLGVAAIDLVSKGETIRDNGMVVVQQLMTSYPELIWAEPGTASLIPKQRIWESNH